MTAVISYFVASPSAAETAHCAGRPAAALALGTVIGVERQWRQRMAGLPTNALVSLGAPCSCYSVTCSPDHPSGPDRIAAYVIQSRVSRHRRHTAADGVNERRNQHRRHHLVSSAVAP